MPGVGGATIGILGPMADETLSSPGGPTAATPTVARERADAPAAGPSDESSARLALAPSELRSLLQTLPDEERRALLKDLLLYAPWQQIFEVTDERELAAELPQLALPAEMERRWASYLGRHADSAGSDED